VLKEENISINDEEYEEMLDELAESSGYTKEDILKIYSKEDLNEMFIYTKVYESAVEWQNYIIVEAEEN
jgi:FKBP-type peptidyl-prolyl cis-trans isomerase (trigger factor)